jgi:hypothetical protein
MATSGFYTRRGGFDGEGRAEKRAYVSNADKISVWRGVLFLSDTV